MIDLPSVDEVVEPRHLADWLLSHGRSWVTTEEAAELLGIPHDEHTQAGLFPIAYTTGTTFARAARDRSAATIGWNRFSG